MIQPAARPNSPGGACDDGTAVGGAVVADDFHSPGGTWTGGAVLSVVSLDQVHATGMARDRGPDYGFFQPSPRSSCEYREMGTSTHRRNPLAG